MKTRSASSAAVSEVLDDVDNYLDWSVQVKTYLIAQDLWDIIEPTPKPEKVEAAFKAWTKKNAKSLHMIQLSCGPRFRCALRMITSAKTAWDALEKICSYPKSDYEPGISHSLKCTSVLKHFKRKIILQSTRYDKLKKHNLKRLYEQLLPIKMK